MNTITETGLKLDQIVPLGRNAREYSLMFDLASFGADTSVLDCGGGPASFNAEWTWKGRRAVSVDPLYAYGAADIKARIDDTFDGVMAQVERNQSRYRWEVFRDVGHLRTRRLRSMELFLADFVHGKQQGRYVAGQLPNLPFADTAFDVAVCSHLLFLYHDHIDAEFHLVSIREMLRVAGQARIFPLVGFDGALSPYVPHVIRQLKHEGFKTRLLNVPYEFQKGANQCLVVTHR
ncbi:MAG: hypothetical protein QM786_17790 [Breznakibacter sp.]